MTSLEEANNGWRSDQVLKVEAVSLRARSLLTQSLSEIQGGVEKLGGLFNTFDHPRAGGSVEKPEGLFNTSFPPSHR